MTNAHWFSNLCPHFKVEDITLYNSVLGADCEINCLNLAHLELSHAANWLADREKIWRDHHRASQRWLEKVSQGVFKICFWGDRDYPKNLQTLSHPPAVLFYRGELPLETVPYVSVVGARSPTDIGRLWVAQSISEVAKRGAVIVSGGARGIDAEAHWAAVENDGRTIAFLPGSVERPYPRSNDAIFEKILNKGALISEFPPGTEVRKENFHRRNRLIAGLGDVTVIVEAAASSGTLMTAGKAIAENREILVVPGPPLVASYAGSLNLIYSGAPLARDAKDIIFSLVRKNVLKLKEETPTLWS